MTKTIITILIIIATLIFLTIYWVTHRYSVIDKTKSDNYYYNFFKTEIHWVPLGNWFELGDTTLEGIDVKNFTILSPHYIKDAKSAYYQGDKLPNCDIQTFEIVPVEQYVAFAKDKNTLYYGANPLENLDLNTFKIEFINNEFIVSDKNNTYSLKEVQDKHWGKPKSIKPLPKNYLLLNQGYGKDDNFLYFREKPIENSSGENFKEFKTLTDGIVQTQSGVYFEGCKLLNIDNASFSVIDSTCMKDKNGIYCGVDAVNMNSSYPESYEITGYRAIKLEVDEKNFPTYRLSNK